MLPVELLTKKQFVSVATCDLKGQPNAAPKMIFAVEEEFIYLVDYSDGKTLENLKVNPKVSLSLSDPEELKGFKINGTVEILKNTLIPADIMEKLEEKKVALSVDRIIRGIHEQKKHADHEVGVPDRCNVYKITMEEITEISPKGDLQRKTLNQDKKA